MAAALPGGCSLVGLFAGKTVLVTGSTRGIGHATARRFLAEEAEVIIHGQSAAAVQAVVAALPGDHSKVRGLAADLADRKSCDRLAKDAGDLDVLVSCAGIYEEVAIADADEDHWDRIIETNLTAPWRLARGLLDGLVRRSGVVVNVGSDSGLIGYANSAAYCASKGGLIGLTRALAMELAPHVRALCVCPGPVDTDMMRRSVEAQPDPLAARLQWQSYPLLARFAEPDEIAEAILFAASPRCRFQTGSTIIVDGGVTAGRKVP
jgi:NAD(P)-dependent dehydrogenase (short-subunit alcohol dehydrogenase family)